MNVDTRRVGRQEHVNNEADDLPFLRVTASGVKKTPQPKSMYLTCGCAKRSAEFSIIILSVLMS